MFGIINRWLGSFSRSFSRKDIPKAPVQSFETPVIHEKAKPKKVKDSGNTVYHVPAALAKMRRKNQCRMHKLALCRPSY